MRETFEVEGIVPTGEKQAMIGMSADKLRA